MANKTNVLKLIREMHETEDYNTINIEDIVDRDELDEVMDETAIPTISAPVIREATIHLMQRGDSRYVPYTDISKFCRQNKYNISEAVEKIAEYYEINKSDIVVCIEDTSATLGTEITRILDGLENNVSIYQKDYDSETLEDQLSFIFGEDAELEPEIPGTDEVITDKIAITEEEPSEDETIPEDYVSYATEMVTVFKKDYDYVVEMRELSKYMTDSKIGSVREALHNIATANDIEERRISVLTESVHNIKAVHGKNPSRAVNIYRAIKKAHPSIRIAMVK